MTERRTFSLPGQQGIPCYECGAVLNSVYRTTRSDGLIIRERVCPRCCAINTTGERVLHARANANRFSGPVSK